MRWKQRGCAPIIWRTLKQMPLKYSDDDLFLSLLQLEQQLGHEPGAMEHTAQGDYSITPFLSFRTVAGRSQAL